LVAEFFRQERAETKVKSTKKDVAEVVRVPQVVCLGCDLVVSDNGYCRCG
jgi:hypothetical protein